MLDRRQVLTSVAGAALAMMLGSGSALAQGGAAGPIRVGVLLPMSGGAGQQGQNVVAAIQAMAGLINEQGGVLGRQIEIVARDDESTPAVGVSRASELVASGVSVIIEGWNSPVTLAVQPIIARAGILDITAISKADAILSGEGNPLAIRLNSSNSQDGAVIANYLAKDLKARKIAFFVQNDAYGNGAQAAIEAELKRIGHTYEKVAEEKFPFTQNDFRVALTNARAATPDASVLINANDGTGMPALLRQARQIRMPGALVAAVGTIVPSVIATAGESANGVVAADFYFSDIEPFVSNPQNKAFVARVKAARSMEPDKYMALGAASLQVWARAANEMKTLDREALAKRIRGAKIANTILGEMAFEANGQLGTRHYLFTVENLKPVVKTGAP